MSDEAAVAARVLRVALGMAVAGMAAGVLASGTSFGGPLRTVGIGALIAAPYLVLIVVALRHRAGGWYALGALALAAVGYLLAS